VVRRLADEWPEFGQCVPKVARDTTDPDRLYAQNHHGVYRSRDEGVTWDSIADGLPSDPYHPRRAPRRDVRRRRHPGRV